MKRCFHIAACLGLALWPVAGQAAAAAKPAPATPALDLTSMPKGDAVLAAWRTANFRFTPEVKQAWLACAKATQGLDIVTTREAVALLKCASP